jgi:hypothetical protein
MGKGSSTDEKGKKALTILHYHYKKYACGLVENMRKL